MTQPNAKRPGHLGDGRAAKKDRSEGPIASENSRDSRIEQALERPSGVEARIYAAAMWIVQCRTQTGKLPKLYRIARRFDLTDDLADLAVRHASAAECRGE